MPDRTIDLDLWAEGNAERLPAITVTLMGPDGTLLSRTAKIVMMPCI